jgi:hypothetical protein
MKGKTAYSFFGTARLLPWAFLARYGFMRMQSEIHHMPELFSDYPLEYKAVIMGKVCLNAIALTAGFAGFLSGSSDAISKKPFYLPLCMKWSTGSKKVRKNIETHVIEVKSKFDEHISLKYFADSIKTSLALIFSDDYKK